VRVGPGRASIGVDLNSRTGLSPTGRIRLIQLGPLSGGISAKGGAEGPTASIRVWGIFSVGASFKAGGIKSVNIGARLGKLANAQVYASDIHIGRPGDPLAGSVFSPNPKNCEAK
jgi:hypothetical protein